jgi:hypothetical protein
MRRVEDTSEPDGPTNRSGVRARTAAVEQRILVVEPDLAVRTQLLEQARSIDVPLQVSATPEEAALLRAREQADFVACSFPLAGSVGLVESLHRERFPVVIITGDVLRAIATFGLEIPILPKPASLASILEQAHALAASRSAARLSRVALSAEPTVRRTITEVPPPRNPRDPRRD